MSGQDIRTVLTQLTNLQKTLAISDPVALTVKRAYKLAPPRKAALTDLPCWINAWTFAGQNRKTTGLLQQNYTVHCQLFIKEADLDRGADIASAFHAVYVTALNRNITLSGACDTSELRGGDPTVAMLEWNGEGYPGLDLFLDVTLSQGMTFQ